ncbi:MAG: flippase-like domain-containing protein [Deferribacteres bacterium]|nr:flippase-like domain-containing protein [candidate division KSB1 bacterium]MCB9503356.1 flippase-like domain-containing protein [Deferribacteres bacterium]
MKQISGFFFKGLISIGLISALLYWKVDLKELGQAFQQVDYLLYIVSTLLFFIQQGVIAWCWQIVLRAQDNQIPFKRILQVHWIGAFFGTFMPTSIGMDIVRAFSLKKYLRNGVHAMSSMFVTRVVGFVINFAIALVVAIPVAQQTGNVRLFWTVLVMTVAFCGGIWLMLHPRLLKLFAPLFQRFKLDRIYQKLVEFQEGTKELRHAKSAMIKLLLLSLFFQIFGIIIIYLVGLSLGLDIAFQHYFIIIPLITTITILPLSVAGIGVREGAFVFFLVPLGATESQAFSLSLLVFAQWVGMALTGGIVYWISGMQISREKNRDINNSAAIELETDALKTKTLG